MPTVLRERAYRFHFYSNEQGEPPHIHVQRDRALAKYWLAPVRLADSAGFAATELRAIAAIVAHREGMLMEAWNDFFRE